MILYNLEYKKDVKIDYIGTCIIIILLCYLMGVIFKENINDYKDIRSFVEYANNNKECCYLSSVPVIQERYLAYSVYEMPKKESYSNIKAMGSWDLYTENYYNLKERYNLDGTYLDLLKDNVYLVDDYNKEDEFYSGLRDSIIIAMDEHYGIKAKYELVDHIGKVGIYKIEELE